MFIKLIKNWGQSVDWEPRCRDALKKMFARESFVEEESPWYKTTRFEIAPICKLAYIVGGAESYGYAGLMPWARIMYVLHGDGYDRPLHEHIIDLRKTVRSAWALIDKRAADANLNLGNRIRCSPNFPRPP